MLLSRIIRRIRLGWYALMRHRYREQLRKLFGPTTTIISNNCFGGRISQDLGYAYNSPTVGLFFYYPDYVVFLQHLREFLAQPLLFKKEVKLSGGGEVKKPYPVGCLSFQGLEVEIHFLHYPTEAVAAETWTRRVRRINWDDMVVLGGDVDGCTEEDIEAFSRLPYKRKLFFAKRDRTGMEVCRVSVLGSPRFTNMYELAHCFYPHLCRYIRQLKIGRT